MTFSPPSMISIGDSRTSPSLSEFIMLAFNPQIQILLDSSVLNTIENSSNKNQKMYHPSNFYTSGNESDENKSDINVSIDKEDILPHHVSRGVILALLIHLMKHNVVIRTEIVTFLRDLLNHDIIPVILFESISNDNDLMKSLVSYFQGKGPCTTKNITNIVDIKSHFDKHPSLTFPGLLQFEYEYLQLVPIFCIALSAIAIYEFGVCSQLAEVIVACDYESIQINTNSFLSVNQETSRPHHGQTKIIKHLRLLMEGSKMNNSNSNSKTKDITNDIKHKDHRSFLCFPQYHGPIYQCYEDSVATIGIELHSQPILTHPNPNFLPSSLSDLSYLSPLHLQPLIFTLSSIQRHLIALMRASVDRIEEIINNCVHYDLPVGLKLDDSKEDTGFTPLISAAHQQVEALNNQLTHISELSQEKDIPVILKIVNNTIEKCFGILAIETGLSLQCLYIKDQRKIEQSRQRMLLAEQKAQEIKNKKGNKQDPKSRVIKGITIGKGSSLYRQLFSQFQGIRSSSQLQNILNDIRTILSPNNYLLSVILDQWFSSRDLTTRHAKLPKGTRDFGPGQMIIRDRTFNIIRQVFRRHGACTIDTPVFELKNTLFGQYGEEQKLVFDLEDQGGELLSLRYDLTVPFARYLASNNINNIKRYHIGRVYRRDNPVEKKGRYREFYQCDYDVAGVYDNMVADSDVIKVVTEILDELEIHNYQIKYSHRQLLQACMNVSGVSPEKFMTICSSVDKLDKMDWNEVRKEMIHQKGLKCDVADMLGKFVNRKSDTFNPSAESQLAILNELKTDPILSQDVNALKTIQDLELLINYLSILKIDNRCVLDLSLARGLTYYTGLIYEAVVLDAEVGSIAAGGRYDELVGQFSKNINTLTPCVGVSIGIERIYTLMLDKYEQDKLPTSETQVLVARAGVKEGPSYLEERMKICCELWSNNIKAEYLYYCKPKTDKQLDHALRNKIPLIIWVGEQEVLKQNFTVKDLEHRQEYIIPRSDLVVEIKKLLDNPSNEEETKIP